MTLEDLMNNIEIQGRVQVKVIDENGDLISVLETDYFEYEYDFFKSEYVTMEVKFMYSAQDILQIEIEERTM